jgi:hypothetical protein
MKVALKVMEGRLSTYASPCVNVSLVKLKPHFACWIQERALGVW